MWICQLRDNFLTVVSRLNRISIRFSQVSTWSKRPSGKGLNYKSLQFWSFGLIDQIHALWTHEKEVVTLRFQTNRELKGSGRYGKIRSRLQESLSRLVLYPNVFAPGHRVSGTKRYASQKQHHMTRCMICVQPVWTQVRVITCLMWFPSVIKVL